MSTGEFTSIGEFSATFIPRFWAKVQKASDDQCWLWLGAIKPNGYGAFGAKRGIILYAHRAAWLIVKGAIPKGLFVLHKCDNPRCVNPSHLFLGTHTDNMRDCIQKNRFDRTNKPKGEKHWHAKLDEVKVRQIRKLYEAGMPHRQIADYFGVGHNTVFHIVAGRHWRHVV